MARNARFPHIFRRSLIVTVWVAVIFMILFSSNLTKSPTQKEKTLNIFTWSDVIPNKVIQDFEKETGVKVVLDYYSSNEELFIKLKASRGAGYDLVIPSDYAVKSLTREGFLKKIDKSKLNFLEDINPFLLSHDYDPKNEYSLPLQWDVCGFGVDTEKLELPLDQYKWDHLFDEKTLSYKIAMTNDPVEAFCLASYYLFGKKKALTHEEARLAKDLLLKQKRHVEAYAIPRSDFVLASKNAAIAFGLSAHVIRSQVNFPFMKFIVPNDATFLSIENIAIPSGARENPYIYDFINYLYKADSLSQACNEFGVFPATMSSRAYLKYKNELKEIEKQITKSGYQLHFFRHLIPEEEMRSLWVDVKS